MQFWKVVAAFAELPVESLEYNVQSNFEDFNMSTYQVLTPQAESRQGEESCREDLLSTLTIYLPVKLSVDLPYGSQKLLPFSKSRRIS